MGSVKHSVDSYHYLSTNLLSVTWTPFFLNDSTKLKIAVLACAGNSLQKFTNLES